MIRGAARFVLAFALALIAPGRAAADEPDYARALELYRKGDPAAASSILEGALGAGRAGAAERILLGWCRLRLDDLPGAGEAFGAAAASDPRSAEARTGLAYVALRAGRLAEAQAAFDRALGLDPSSAEAWKGLGLARRALGDAAGALAALERAVELAPEPEGRGLLAELRALGGIERERRPRGPRPASAALELSARARAARFEVRRRGRWEPLFVRGVNLGTALPGRYPAEFPDDLGLYRRWFDQIDELGANVVRLYTLHPPSLYRALFEHNRERPERKLWLVQGVWAELPEDDDYDGPEFAPAIHDEVRRVIDAVHGNLELPPRPGHAHGRYTADVSGDVLAFLLGREWEPFSVEAYERLRRARPQFAGVYLQSQRARPMEVWLAALCEVAAAHETEVYRAQHPLGFTSWPTLDPLEHPTESTAAEEQAWLGAPLELRARDGHVYDEDKVALDATRLVATAAFPAGVFAAYHAYPYYPDFMLLDPGYAQARDAQGVSRYLGYLEALSRHHGEQPVLVAELGVPSSRGIAHVHPEGQHHGGHTEREQGEIDLRLFGDIERAGLAGGVVFSWLDEWFKRTWITYNRESPAERNRLWHNVMDPEQNFGLLAARPGASGFRVVLDGRGQDWSGVPALYGRAQSAGELGALRASADEAYLYLELELAPERAGPIDWMRRRWLIGIDTYDAERGDRAFPSPLTRGAGVGLEFLIDLRGERDSRLLIDPPYRMSSGDEHRPCRSEPNADGSFVEIVAAPNRERIGRDGTRYPAREVSESVLRHGTTDPGAAAYDSLADWFAAPDGRRIELRLPWGLLNVADPSSRQVIHEERRTSGPAETATTPGFRFHVLALERQGEGWGVRESWPAGQDPDVADYPIYAWPTWDRPTYRLEPKDSYRVLQRAWRGAPAK